MKRFLFLPLMCCMLIAVVSCTRHPQVVSPVDVPNIDSLKTYVDKATQSKDALDQFFAAEYYLEQHTASDTAKAISLLIESANQDNPWAANTLGNIYSADSTDTHYDIAQAVKYYELGVKNGSDRAMTNLANLYMTGEGVEIDYEKALSLRTDAMLGLLKLAEEGDAAAQARLGENIFDGTGIAQNRKAAVEWIRKSADQGHIVGIKYMAYIYRNGSGGVKQDLKEALNYYLKAADKGDSWAMYNVGQCFASGIGTESDLSKSFEYYLKSAKLGYDDAMFEVALCYRNGRGTDTDYTEAFKWYKKCAERGDKMAQNNIGAMYQEGTGVAKDEKEAFKWFLKAAEAGSSWSQRVVGDCYYEGTGVESDKTKAFEWYKKSAAGGDKTGMQRLGLCYRYGIGTPKDEEQASYWIFKSR